MWRGSGCDSLIKTQKAPREINGKFAVKIAHSSWVWLKAKDITFCLTMSYEP